MKNHLVFVRPSLDEKINRLLLPNYLASHLGSETNFGLIAPPDDNNSNLISCRTALCERFLKDNSHINSDFLSPLCINGSYLGSSFDSLVNEIRELWKSKENIILIADSNVAELAAVACIDNLIFGLGVSEYKLNPHCLNIFEGLHPNSIYHTNRCFQFRYNQLCGFGNGGGVIMNSNQSSPHCFSECDVISSNSN